jgi:hypothetical protein
MKRTYILARDPIPRRGIRPPRRAILETCDGHREVFLVVDNADSVDVLEALRRAYADGREDRAAELAEDPPGEIPADRNE